MIKLFNFAYHFSSLSFLVEAGEFCPNTVDLSSGFKKSLPRAYPTTPSPSREREFKLPDSLVGGFSGLPYMNLQANNIGFDPIPALRTPRHIHKKSQFIEP